MYCMRLSNIMNNIKKDFRIKKSDNMLTTSKMLSRVILGQYHGFMVKKKSLVTAKGYYYELRFLGGIDYHLYPEKIETTVRHFSDVLKKSIYASEESNLKKNRKIISYVNRVFAIELPSSCITKNHN